ncbi:hypothetical protein IE81DRAFT_350650 [Ceraceosorus guamensis]|uniref:OTU domain-containing protein n=1 Tax=Ceraceosorus guamensis TaxID=1522189 RepID=A0A316VMP7_9BASI|nr:hypothetical protein IE81DRAFT_350650 [Ceraceosorus guamensis]PWN38909.1 hypothetical protein IE81DRAFT_350650 [Ceraceosorus guamensis]
MSAVYSRRASKLLLLACMVGLAVSKMSKPSWWMSKQVMFWTFTTGDKGCATVDAAATCWSDKCNNLAGSVDFNFFDATYDNKRMRDTPHAWAVCAQDASADFTAQLVWEKRCKDAPGAMIALCYGGQTSSGTAISRLQGDLEEAERDQKAELVLPFFGHAMLELSVQAEVMDLIVLMGVKEINPKYNDPERCLLEPLSICCCGVNNLANTQRGSRAQALRRADDQDGRLRPQSTGLVQRIDLLSSTSVGGYASVFTGLVDLLQRKVRLVLLKKAAVGEYNQNAQRAWLEKGLTAVGAKVNAFDIVVQSPGVISSTSILAWLKQQQQQLPTVVVAFGAALYYVLRYHVEHHLKGMISLEPSFATFGRALACTNPSEDRLHPANAVPDALRIELPKRNVPHTPLITTLPLISSLRGEAERAVLIRVVRSILVAVLLAIEAEGPSSTTGVEAAKRARYLFDEGQVKVEANGKAEKVKVQEVNALGTCAMLYLQGYILHSCLLDLDAGALELKDVTRSHVVVAHPSILSKSFHLAISLLSTLLSALISVLPTILPSKCVTSVAMDTAAVNWLYVVKQGEDWQVRREQDLKVGDLCMTLTGTIAPVVSIRAGHASACVVATTSNGTKRTFYEDEMVRLQGGNGGGARRTSRILPKAMEDQHRTPERGGTLRAPASPSVAPGSSQRPPSTMPPPSMPLPSSTIVSTHPLPSSTMTHISTESPSTTQAPLESVQPGILPDCEEAEKWAGQTGPGAVASTIVCSSLRIAHWAAICYAGFQAGLKQSEVREMTVPKHGSLEAIMDAKDERTGTADLPCLATLEITPDGHAHPSLEVQWPCLAQRRRGSSSSNQQGVASSCDGGLGAATGRPHWPSATQGTASGLSWEGSITTPDEEVATFLLGLGLPSKLYNPGADSHCGFRGVARAVFGQEDLYMLVRQCCCQVVLELPKLWQNMYASLLDNRSDDTCQLLWRQKPCQSNNDQWGWFEAHSHALLVAAAFDSLVVTILPPVALPPPPATRAAPSAALNSSSIKINMVQEAQPCTIMERMAYLSWPLMVRTLISNRVICLVLIGNHFMLAEGWWGFLLDSFLENPLAAFMTAHAESLTQAVPLVMRAKVAQ